MWRTVTRPHIAACRMPARSSSASSAPMNTAPATATTCSSCLRADTQSMGPAPFPGGSTIGGGASVAAGTAMLALGTDTTGSVRLPAAACGTAGLKPTYGLVSRAGVLPNCYSLDCVGPIAWTARIPAWRYAPSPGLTTPIRRAPMRRRGVSARRRKRFASACCDVFTSVTSMPDRSSPCLRARGRGRSRSGATLVDLDLARACSIRNCSRIINTAECYAIHERDYLERGDQMGAALRNKPRHRPRGGGRRLSPGAALAPRADREVERLFDDANCSVRRRRRALRRI